MNKDDQKIIDEALKRFAYCEEQEGKNRERALEDLRFSLGDQWPDAVRRARENDPDGARPCLTVDKLGQYVRQVVNDSRQNKPSIKFRPVDDDADIEVADMLQGLVRHIEDNSRADIAYDTGIEFSVRAGFGYLRIVTDYEDNESFNQEAFIRTVRNPFSVYLDPDHQQLDGSDARYGFCFDDIPRDVFDEQYPDADPCSFEGSTKQNGDWIRKETVRVAEYFRVEETPKTVWQAADGSLSFEAIEGAPSRRILSRKIAWYKLTANEIIERGIWAGKQYIPIVPIYGHVIDVAGERQITGLIHSAIDAQRIHNYSLSAYVERVALVPKAPFIAAEGQIEGHEAEWASANSSNIAVLTYKPTDINGTPVPPPQRQAGADIPSGWMQAMQMTEHDIQASLGMYSASVGAPSNEKSGKAIMARQREADTSTFHFIDNLSRAIRQVGRVLLDVIPALYDTKRVVRILGEDGTAETAEIVPDMEHPYLERTDSTGKTIAKLYNPSIGKYDVTVAVGPAYTTKRQEAADFMTQVAQANPQLMPIIGDLMFRAMDMPYAEEIAERMKLMLPPEIKQAEEQEHGLQQIPPQVQQALQMAGQQIEQLQGALQQAQQQIEQLSGEQASDQVKAELEARKIEIEGYKAETERMRLQVDAAATQKQPEDEAQEAQEMAILQTLMERVDMIAAAINQPMREEVGEAIVPDSITVIG